MSGNLLAMIHRQVDEETVGVMASFLGQSRQTMRSAVDQVAPALVGGLAQKASSDEGARELHANLEHVDDTILDDVPAYLHANTSHVTEPGMGILGDIFGADVGNVLGNLAPATGLGEAGTSSVMRSLAPIALAVVARHQRRERMDSTALAGFLNDQRRDVNSALPASMVGMFGASEGRYGELGERIGEDRDRADRTRTGGQPVAEAEGMHPRHGGGGPGALHEEQLGPEHGGPRRRGERSTSLRWMVPLLGVAAIIALAYGLLRHQDLDRVETGEPTEGAGQGLPGQEPELRSRQQQTEGEVGAITGSEDPGAQTAPAPETAPPQQGAAGNEPLYLGTLFDTGSSELGAAPEDRLSSLLRLVESNQEQQIEVRGYAFGADTEDSQQLAQERAEAVRQWLIDNGVDAARINAVGGGTSARSQVEVFLR